MKEKGSDDMLKEIATEEEIMARSYRYERRLGREQEQVERETPACNEPGRTYPDPGPNRE